MSSHSPSESQRHRPLIPHFIRLSLLVITLLLVFGTLIWIGRSHRHQRYAETQRVLQNNATVVTVVSPEAPPPTTMLSLPADIRPYLQTSIFSRTSGTLGKRLVDIGDHVRAGQLLATVDVPELTQEMAQAKAALTQSQASVAEQQARVQLAKTSLQRWLQNAQSGGVSQQDVAQRQSDYQASQAAYRAAVALVQQNKANIRRIAALQSYQKILAPFSGVITARSVDPGANIVSGGSSTSTNLFTIAQTDTLRVFINVPQANVPSIKTGLAANITLAELPGQVFAGKVTRTANALDPASRTLLTEIDLNNRNHQLQPGLFAQAQLKLPQAGHALYVDDHALVVNDQGIRVIEVTPENKLHFRHIQVGKDNGIRIEVKFGLTGHELLVSNPTDQMREGQTVRVLQSPRKPTE